MGRLTARLASRNEHKLHELRTALPSWTLALLDVDELPLENGSTYYDNARAKARFGRTIGEGDAWILGEDSGIEAHALGGRPGVESARWAADGVAALLGALNGAGDRRARYVCELVAVSPESREFRGTGILEGAVATERRGDQGFGYDPIFVPDGETRTVAELGNEWKSHHSHRARAARALAGAIADAG